jgi:hypothetical protein
MGQEWRRKLRLTLRYTEMRDFFEEVPYLLSGPDARFSFCESAAGPFASVVHSLMLFQSMA